MPKFGSKKDEKHKACIMCDDDLPKSAYSKTMWKARDGVRTCLACEGESGRGESAYDSGEEDGPASSGPRSPSKLDGDGYGNAHDRAADTAGSASAGVVGSGSSKVTDDFFMPDRSFQTLRDPDAANSAGASRAAFHSELDSVFTVGAKSTPPARPPGGAAAREAPAAAGSGSSKVTDDFFMPDRSFQTLRDPDAGEAAAAVGAAFRAELDSAFTGGAKSTPAARPPGGARGAASRAEVGTGNSKLRDDFFGPDRAFQKFRDEPSSLDDPFAMLEVGSAPNPSAAPRPPMAQASAPSRPAAAAEPAGFMQDRSFQPLR